MSLHHFSIKLSTDTKLLTHLIYLIQIEIYDIDGYIFFKCLYKYRCCHKIFTPLIIIYYDKNKKKIKRHAARVQN